MKRKPADASRCGTGVSPVLGPHGRDARATQDKPHGRVQIRIGAFLPHWTQTDGGIYAVTFRLADSLPRSVMERLIRERDAPLLDAACSPAGVTDAERKRVARQHVERIEAHLDAGSGACWMKQPGIADLVAGAMQHFAGQRYHLHAWCIMPNHVHALVEPLAGHRLPDIVHSWKSYTAKVANRFLGRTGAFWQTEYYDHLIRDEGDYLHAVRYMEGNPEKAGLKDWRWVSRRTGDSAVQSKQERPRVME